jgi:hypothetical protein
MLTSSVVHSIAYILAFSNISIAKLIPLTTHDPMGSCICSKAARLARTLASIAAIGQAQMARVAAQLSATNAGPR